jgi:hypothetical protein
MEFTTWERVQLIAIVGGVTGSAAQIRQAGRLLDVLEFTEAEAAAVGLVQTDSQLGWRDAEKVWPLDLPAGATGLMRKALQDYAGFQARDRRHIAALMAKLDAQPAPDPVAASAGGPA